MAKSATPMDALVGSRLRSRRKQLRISQEKLGKEVGVSFQQVQKYENGTNRIGAGRLAEISKVLDVPVAYFFTGNSGGASSDGERGDTRAILSEPGANRAVAGLRADRQPGVAECGRAARPRPRRQLRRRRPRSGQARPPRVRQRRQKPARKNALRPSPPHEPVAAGAYSFAARQLPELVRLRKALRRQPPRLGAVAHPVLQLRHRAGVEAAGASRSSSGPPPSRTRARRTARRPCSAAAARPCRAPSPAAGRAER